MCELVVVKSTCVGQNSGGGGVPHMERHRSRGRAAHTSHSRQGTEACSAPKRRNIIKKGQTKNSMHLIPIVTMFLGQGRGAIERVAFGDGVYVSVIFRCSLSLGLSCPNA